MNKIETLGILSVLKSAYPAFYKDISKQEAENIVNLWAEMFAADDFNTVKAAVKAHIASDTKGFPPVIGQIKEKLNIITSPAQMTEQEAWSHVSRAIKNSAYHAAEEFDKLPEILKKVVGGPSQLKDWALTESKEAQTVIASNVMRSYRVELTQNKEYKALPSDVKKLMENASTMIEGGVNG
ncbi:hypothetical protein HZF24_11915 [Sedimentibacter hydroxybenzoicus DSM 7310]|uniref:Replicative helicase inhibitor G39P N-terminal domain-containing protein n=1 Tax=Sedimentibacter hydroxybenzoicus DSM 7310 TaxID=1123245 RepID=A0A974GWT8_SEDHY|nr:replicative helicase loader/inhibitor [Sedimentibacter hydroxybenzoicus]NYB74844.1 hypothetical protein [Sedimentibacter hydroxybenzoicus DSM 7310]